MIAALLDIGSSESNSLLPSEVAGVGSQMVLYMDTDGHSGNMWDRCYTACYL